LLEQRVAARTHELATLLDVAHNVASTLELQPLLGIILEQLKAVVDYSHAVISTHPGTDISILDDRGTLPRDAALQMHFSVTGTLAAENDQQLLIIDDVGGDTSWARTIRMIAGETRQRQGDVVRSFLSVPLRAKERLLGRLSLTHHEPNYFTPQRAALAKAVADHAAVAIEHATLYARAQELAVVEERQRLARELHDSVTQSLYSLTLFAEAAHLLAANGEWESVAGYLVRLGETAQQALAEMRLLLYELRPSALEQAGLVGALQRRLDAVEKRAGINAQLLVEGVIDLPAAVIDALYRILEEALNNTLKHAGATTVQVRIRAAAHEVEAEVVDDGKGFTLQVLPDTGGLGLTSMQERAEQLGGALALASAPGAGTRIHVVLPLPDR
jgi:signal transduction histidine kinase